jgi:hypothetical protein
MDVPLAGGVVCGGTIVVVDPPLLLFPHNGLVCPKTGWGGDGAKRVAVALLVAGGSSVGENVADGPVVGVVAFCSVAAAAGRSGDDAVASEDDTAILLNDMVVSNGVAASVVFAVTAGMGMATRAVA